MHPHIFASLCGYPGKWACTLDEGIDISVQDLLMHMEKTFGNKHDYNAMIKTLYKVQQKEDEMVEEYMLCIHEAAAVICHAYPECLPDRGRDLKKDRFYHGHGHSRIGAVCQDHVRAAYGSGRLQQVPDLAACNQFPQHGELWWIASHPQGVEVAQVVEVQPYAVKDPAPTHVIQGWPHGVGVVGLHLAMFGKVTNHGVLHHPACNTIGNFVAMPSIKACVEQPHFLPSPMTECLVSWRLFLGRQ